MAVAQVKSERQPDTNLHAAERLVTEAASAGATMVVFPEYLMSWGGGRHEREDMTAVAQPLTGPFVEGLRSLARSHGVMIVAGVIEAQEGESGKPFNTTVVVSENGQTALVYRKTHLFDAFRHRESDVFSAGGEASRVIETPLGPAGFFVCYELRFPEVARRLALDGADLLIVPSAWVAGPLKDMHWEVLLRARAIENGCYVVAAAQTGNEYAGQSMVIDPMGTVVAGAGTGEGLIFAPTNRELVRAARETIPSLAHRRATLY